MMNRLDAILRLFFLLITPYLGMSWCFADSSIKPVNLRNEYLENPTGLDEPLPRFSWILTVTHEKAFGQKQQAYRILVASSKALLQQHQADLWDSKWVSSNTMQQIVYGGKALASDRTYYWKVAVKDEKGEQSAWSEPAYWSTGLFHASEKQAQWIGTDQLFDPRQADCNIVDPWLRKSFDLSFQPQKATLFVASVGFHEVYVNGKRIGDDVLAPAVTDHTKRARYVAYDLAPALKKGKNVVAIWLGTSWSIHGPYVTKDRPNTPIVWAQAAIFKEKTPSANAQPDKLLLTDAS